jgi:hypothetical protein
MALTISQTGSEISTEKLLVTAVSDNPLVTSVVMNIFINGNGVAADHQLEHLPDFGTTSDFSFEINSIVKDYFASEFLPLSGVNQTTIENAIVGFRFLEVISSVVQPAIFTFDTLVYNMTQDTFEIEEFDLSDYDCGDAGSTSSKLLTSSPAILPTGDNTSVHVSCLTTSYTGGVTPKQEWFVQTFLNGGLVATFNEAVNVPDRSIPVLVSAGKYDISNYRIDFHGGVFDEVRIYIRDIASPFTIRSETKTYVLNDACEKSITLSWLNEFGTQDSFTFLGNITRTGKYTDSTFKKVRPVNPLSTDVGDLVYKSSYNYEYDLFSDRMPETSVQWLSKILINKRAAIQIPKEELVNKPALLYNRFALNGGVDGDGRAVGGIVNTNLASWRVSQQADFDTLIAFLGGVGVAGGELKEVGFTSWNSPNTGATNSSGFTSLANGNRDWANGSFNDVGDEVNYWTGDAVLGDTAIIMLYNNAGIGKIVTANYTEGMSVRLMRPAVGGETNGQLISNAYTGNNGEVYDGIVIGTQVWINKSLYETKYNDGSSIANVTDNTAWSNLTTGGVCSYNNEPIVFATPVANAGLYFPITITTEETILEDKFTPETLFRLKFRLANRRKGLK